MCHHITEETPMKSVTVVVLCFVVFAFASAQQTQGTSAGFGVASTVPANLATNVSASTTTVSVTFSDVVDTTLFVVQGKGNTRCTLTNFDSLTAVSFSPDRKTVNFTVQLVANKAYFAAVYSAKSASHVPMDASYAFYFTTAASFPTSSVSGNVLSGTSGVGTGGSFVALSTIPLSAGDPLFAAGGIADGLGHFTVPYVPNGTLYPIAAKDVSGDGNIDPSTGDVVGSANAVVVNNGNVTGLNITFTSAPTYRFKDAVDSVNKYTGSLAGLTLSVIQGTVIDSTGCGSFWEFDYTGSNWQTSKLCRVETFGVRIQPMDSSQYLWVSQSGAIGTLPAPAVVDSFLARAERSGGYSYRPVPMSWNNFDVRLNIGKLTWQGYQDMIPNQSNNYLGLSYAYYTGSNMNQMPVAQRRFLGDYSTGSILGTTAVSPTGNGGIPDKYALSQNYPNPFNPATKIEFTLPATSTVQLRVYNMLGQEVATLVNGTVAAGSHTASFDGSHLASGIYIYRLVAGSFASTMKMVLVK
jgi:hypothetical protein